jgi:ABC-type antimicrobial peptide transport system permease subunit
LNAALVAIIFYLGLLSIQLIYSLMVSDVNEKTYEFGMLRALGFNTTDIMQLIFFQAMFFAIPGIILGLGFGLMLNAGFRVALFSVTWNYTTYNLPMEAYTMGIFIGIIMPVVSNILPIQRAIGKNLRSSLDMNHRS